MGLLFKEKGVNSFPQQLTPTGKGDKTVNDRIVDQECASIHLNGKPSESKVRSQGVLP